MTARMHARTRELGPVRMSAEAHQPAIVCYDSTWATHARTWHDGIRVWLRHSVCRRAAVCASTQKREYVFRYFDLRIHVRTNNKTTTNKQGTEYATPPPTPQAQQLLYRVTPGRCTVCELYAQAALKKNAHVRVLGMNPPP